MSGFLPITMEELAAQGITQPDFICVTGDAYVDHPSFGIAIISRLVQSMGYSVAMLAQPDWHTDRDFTRFGRPKYGFLVTSGNIDSMVSHYTAAKRLRSDDPYSAGGKAGKRPDRAVIVYSQKIKSIYPDCPVVIGGLEASLRRFAHYDYWDDAVRPSILLESGADLLSYGMGERSMSQIVSRLAAGEPVQTIHDIRGTCFLTGPNGIPSDSVSCASLAKVSSDKTAYARATKLQLDEQDAITGKAVVQKHGEQYLVQLPPAPPLTQKELDDVFALPFTRMYHPVYEKDGGVKAIEEVEFSIIHNRGCFGHCNFCSIALHQGRVISCRSEQSILKEAESFTHNPRFKGYIHDVGGPTANFRQPSCKKQLTKGLCMDRKCLAPKPCPALQVDHSEYLNLLRKLRNIKGVKKVFVRSGLRYDYIIKDPDPTFLQELVEHHISGQLKVAPEHCSAPVLDKMGKPHIGAYEEFEKRFYAATQKAGKQQYLVPYLMSSHPGCTLQDAVQLALFLKKHRIHPEQVQDFYPTPGTLSTCMFYTGLDPMTMEPVYIPRTAEEKRLQRVLLQYFKPENRSLVIEALEKAGRRDLIGSGKDCLVTPDAAYLRRQREYAQARSSERGKQKKPSRYAKKKPTSRKGR